MTVFIWRSVHVLTPACACHTFVRDNQTPFYIVEQCVDDEGTIVHNKLRRRTVLLRITTCWIKFACVAIAAIAFGSAYGAETKYPSKPIRMLVGFAPGGAADVIARTLAQSLGRTMAQQIVVDNRPGAAGAIAAVTGANATPDGYTLLFVTTTHAISGSLQRLSYDPLKSFAPVTLLASAPQVLLVNVNTQASTVAELIELAKKKHGVLNYGSAGHGSTTHLAAELFKSMAGIDATHVPYKSGSLAIGDLIRHNIQMMFFALPGAMPHIKAGRVKVLATTSTKRSPALPTVSTISETLNGYEVANWFGILAPAGTSRSLVSRIHPKITHAMSTPDATAVLTGLGAVAEGQGPDHFRAFLSGELRKWANLVKKTGIQGRE